jgi:hypothetical protein
MCYANFRVRVQLRLLVAIFAATLCARAADPAVRAWQSSIILATWEEGPPEEVPTFDILAPGRSWYPYPTRSRLGKQRSNQEWRTLNLENEYLSCTVLPDLGGHLYGCRDKLSGYEMFHRNASIKKAMAGLRGSWAALGLELNFPNGHSLLTVSPVDFGVTQATNAASVWVGATDRVTGMRWVVEFSLESGSAVLRQNVSLENPTPVRHRYYWWSNAGITLQPDTRFIVPTRLIATHGLTNIDTWPRSTSGVDRSVVANYADAVGLFARGSNEPFLAAYHPGTRTGTLHYADPSAVPGKKIWTWGRKEDKRIRDELSDDNSSYVEIQAGLFENQETYAFFQPWQSRSFTEYWMPIRKLDGISQASLDGVLFLERRGGALVAQFLPVRAMAGTRIEIRSGTAAASMETVDLDPSAPFSKTIPNAQSGPYTFRLLDAGGKLLLAHTEGDYHGQAAGSEKLGPRPERDWSKVATAQDYLDRAEYNELQGQFQVAANDYAKAIGLFPPSLALRKGAGRLAAETNRFADAAAHLRAALALAPADAEAHYYLGLALAGQGEDKEARREWTAAREDAAFGPLAALESAAALARTASARAAVDALRAALRSGAKPARAGAIEAALLRAAGDTGAAAALASAAQRDPTYFVARYESLRQGGTDEALWEHLAADPERVLEIADLYMHWGLFGDALAALEYKYAPVPANRTEPGAVLPQDYALVAYYRGYCRERLGKDGDEDYRAASLQPVRYVFPNRAGTLLVLEAALRRNPADASAHYLLGLEYLDAGMAAQAAGEWRAAQQARPGFPEAGALLAALPAALPRLPEAAFPVAEKLAELAPATLASAAPPAIRPGLPPREIAAAALLNAAMGNLDGALAAFNAANFPQEKQDDLVREAWIELQLQHLLALAAAHQCAAADQGITTLGYEDKSLPFTFRGFGAFTKGARFQYQLGLVEAACMGEKSAHRRWQRVAKIHAAPSSTDFAYPYLAAGKVNPAAVAANAKPALEEIQHALATAGTDSRAALLYSQGLLLQVLQRTDEAAESFREGLNAAPQGMVQYLNAGALRNMR